jgi:hypothetical protein
MAAQNGKKTMWAGILGSLAVAITAWIPNLAGWIDSVSAKNNAQAAALLAAENKVDNDDAHEDLRAEYQSGLRECATKAELTEAVEKLDKELQKRNRRYEPVAAQLQLETTRADSMDPSATRPPKPSPPSAKRRSPKGKAERIQRLLEAKGIDVSQQKAAH